MTVLTPLPVDPEKRSRMTDIEDRPADAPRRVNTEYGPLLVEPWLLRLWNKYGWPEDHVLQQMAEAQREGPQR